MVEGRDQASEEAFPSMNTADVAAELGRSVSSIREKATILSLRKSRNCRMTIEFECPHCKTTLKAPDGLAGKTGPCPSCKKEVTVPEKKGKKEESK